MREAEATGLSIDDVLDLCVPPEEQFGSTSNLVIKPDVQFGSYRVPSPPRPRTNEMPRANTGETPAPP